MPRSSSAALISRHVHIVEEGTIFGDADGDVDGGGVQRREGQDEGDHYDNASSLNPDDAVGGED